ncbi:MAG: amidohydrolase family protein [Acidobacteriota bacterium]|nr:amidohydrolase family protein [Acidobacteriota bacterium]
MIIEGNIPARGWARIRIESGLIQSVEVVGPTADSQPFVAPGLIDIQVNGFAGVDFSEPELTIERALAVLPRIWKTGVTSFCPTLVTNTHEGLKRNFRILAAAFRLYPQFARSVPCFHLEGPYISPGGALGAHNAQNVRWPDWGEFQELQEAAEGHIGIVTLAPELPGAMDFIRRLCASGVLVAVGHTDASAEQIHQAVEAGARLSTHLGNGCPEMMHRHLSPLWAEIAMPELNASIICDGFHLPPDLVNVILLAKTIGRCILITDAVSPATMPPGRYRTLNTEVELLPNNKVVAAGGKMLAGSAASLNHVVEVFLRYTGVPLVDALAAATTNPARLLGADGLCSCIAEGQPANIFMFQPECPNLGITGVYLGGEKVFCARP